MTTISKAAFWPVLRKLHLVLLIESWRKTRRQRNALLRLDERLLKDIGISRDIAKTEGCRPFWDAPPHWLSNFR